LPTSLIMQTVGSISLPHPEVMIPLQLVLPDNSSASFFYELMIPIITILFISRYVFLRFMNTFHLRSIFPNIELKHEKEFWGSVFYVLAITASLAIGEYTTGFESWRSDYEQCFRGWPHEQFHSNGLKFYFTFCMSFYIYSLLLLWFEEKKKDTTAMVLHHIVTMITVGLSGWIQHYRIGVCIMMLFDVCDIALELAKLANKIKEEAVSFACFVVFFALWIRNRLYLFPVYIMPTIYNGEIISNHEIPFHKVHVVVIGIIFALQVYWSYYIVRKLMSYGKNGYKKAGGDPRDEKDDISNTQ